MPTPQDLEIKFWKALRTDVVMMLGLNGVEDGHTRPMSAQVEDQEGPIWFFTSKDHALIKALDVKGSRAIATFTAKNYDVFAAVHGTLHVDTDPATLDRLWNRSVAAWYEGGKSDPKLALVRLDPEYAEIWLNGSSVLTGIKVLMGADPKKVLQQNVAKVRLD